MTPEQLKLVIIRPILKDMALWSVAAEQLLLGTALHESGGLKRITQYEDGPALSYFQMEPETLDDLYENYLNFRPQLLEKLHIYKIATLSGAQNLTFNLAYATAAARLQYYRFSDPIPSNLEGQAKYWKNHWNTAHGKGTVEQYKAHFKQYFKGD